ncbi:MAG: hypothetical protein ACI9TF_000814 [Paracrocinitomix sp.]|jgi:hypothetical protein
MVTLLAPMSSTWSSVSNCTPARLAQQHSGEFVLVGLDKASF